MMAAAPGRPRDLIDEGTAVLDCVALPVYVPLFEGDQVKEYVRRQLVERPDDSRDSPVVAAYAYLVAYKDYVARKTLGDAEKVLYALLECERELRGFRAELDVAIGKVAMATSGTRPLTWVAAAGTTIIKNAPLAVSLALVYYNMAVMAITLGMLECRVPPGMRRRGTEGSYFSSAANWLHHVFLSQALPRGELYAPVEWDAVVTAVRELQRERVIPGTFVFKAAADAVYIGSKCDSLLINGMELFDVAMQNARGGTRSAGIAAAAKWYASSEQADSPPPAGFNPERIEEDMKVLHAIVTACEYWIRSVLGWVASTAAAGTDEASSRPTATTVAPAVSAIEKARAIDPMLGTLLGTAPSPAAAVTTATSSSSTAQNEETGGPRGALLHLFKWIAQLAFACEGLYGALGVALYLSSPVRSPSGYALDGSATYYRDKYLKQSIASPYYRYFEGTATEEDRRSLAEECFSDANLPSSYAGWYQYPPELDFAPLGKVAWCTELITELSPVIRMFAVRISRVAHDQAEQKAVAANVPERLPSEKETRNRTKKAVLLLTAGAACDLSRRNISTRLEVRETAVAAATSNE
jgi:hypothetical protein